MRHDTQTRSRGTDREGPRYLTRNLIIGSPQFTLFQSCFRNSVCVLVGAAAEMAKFWKLI